MTTRDYVRLDRRSFIAGGAAAAVVISPIAQAVAAALPAAALDAPVPQPALLCDWTIDDMWGVYPRPSEPIGFGRPRGDGALVAGVHPADELFVV